MALTNLVLNNSEMYHVEIYKGHLKLIATPEKAAKWEGEMRDSFLAAKNSNAKGSFGIFGTAQDNGLTDTTKKFIDSLAFLGVQNEYVLTSGGGNDGAMGYSMRAFEKIGLILSLPAYIAHLRLLWRTEWDKGVKNSEDLIYEKPYKVMFTENTRLHTFPPFPNLLSRTGGLVTALQSFPHPKDKTRTWIAVDGGNGTDLEIFTLLNDNSLSESLIGPKAPFRLVLFDDFEGGISSWTSLMDHLIDSANKNRRTHPKDLNITILRHTDRYEETDYRGVKLILGPFDELAKYSLELH